MANLTIRNIPDYLLKMLRNISKTERRSINSEILVLLEKSVKEYHIEKTPEDISVEAQIELWNKLSGEWEDPRPTSEIIDDILYHRSPGRKVDL